MGDRAVDANEVYLDNYEVLADTLIGNAGQGFKIILHGKHAKRRLVAGEAFGLRYAALAKAAQHARDGVVLGRPIGQNQAISNPLADALMYPEAAKLSKYHAARLYDDSRKDDGIGQHTIGIACNSAQYLAAEAAYTACERAVRSCGEMGYVTEYDVE